MHAQEMYGGLPATTEGPRSPVERAAQQEVAVRAQQPAAAPSPPGSGSSAATAAATAAGGGEPSYELQLIEHVHAHFDGDSLRNFKVRSRPAACMLRVPVAHPVHPPCVRRAPSLLPRARTRHLQATGELRALQLGGFGRPHAFRLQLESDANVRNVALNGKLCQDDAAAGRAARPNAASTIPTSPIPRSGRAG